MRRKILDQWSGLCYYYICTCGRPISGCREHKHSGIVAVRIKEGCHRCFDRWMKQRIEKAFIAGSTPKVFKEQ